MSQTEVHPVKESCKHLRARYKLQQNRKLPFPERRLIRHECALGHAIGSDEELEQCLQLRMDCWRSDKPAADPE